jgi:hypothetical protein
MNLDVSFVRTAGAHDRVYVHRANGTATGWSFPSYGDQLPHDLVHLVVESSFGVKQGFWGRVAASADPARVNADANRRGGKDKYAAFGEDLRELYLAEALANARWWDSNATDEDRQDDIARECARSSVPVPATVTLAAVRGVREELDRLRERWRGLAAKGTLRASFPESQGSPSRRR